MAEEKVIRALESRGVETKKVQRNGYTSDLINWADVIFTTGGDGTFLLGASKIRHPDKPVIGINTDPTRSEGYLCVPKHFSFNLDHAIEMLLNGHFRWFFRRRLRITLIGDNGEIYESAIELHKQQLQYPEYRYMDFLQVTFEKLRNVEKLQKLQTKPFVL
jgi:NAD+ kinase